MTTKNFPTKTETELKTLKDLKHLVEREEGIPDYEAVDIISLKAEAIKWVKEDLKDIEDLPIRSPLTLLERWINRFNLTEEDLK